MKAVISMSAALTKTVYQWLDHKKWNLAGQKLITQFRARWKQPEAGKVIGESSCTVAGPQQTEYVIWNGIWVASLI
jgi:hypothetical protein